MAKEYPICWLVEIVEKILERNEELITLATGKTHSEYIYWNIKRNNNL
ncbi:MAG: hypothetical protein ACFFB0_16915 [Promethearchaeota archaeon]